MDQKITGAISAPEITKKEKPDQTETMEGLINIKVDELTARIPAIQGCRARQFSLSTTRVN